MAALVCFTAARTPVPAGLPFSPCTRAGATAGTSLRLGLGALVTLFALQQHRARAVEPGQAFLGDPDQAESGAVVQPLELPTQLPPGPGRQAAAGGPTSPVASVYLLPPCSTSPVTLRRMSASATASAPCRPARVWTMTPLVRGTPSASSARTAGATWSIRALMLPEPVKVAGLARLAVV